MPTASSRKRKATTPTDAEEEAARAIFRKHFEAQFEPLPQKSSKAEKKAHDEDEDDEDFDGDSGSDSDGDEDDGDSSGEDGEEWGGISDDDEPEPAVEVVDYSASATSNTALLGKREHKAFMSSRPPSHHESESKRTAASTTPASDYPEDARTLLAQDLELHRLITESHLLDPTSKLHSKPFTEGRIRMHTTDLRITSLAPGSASILKQKKMPMSMRKGIESTKTRKEETRRREARENGVILERKGGDAAGPGKRAGGKKRGGPRLDMPGIGRLKGAELTLSDRDIRGMESGGSSRGRGRGRGGMRVSKR
ncbi:uncharacterized protein DNG_03251 [Cephalotrichum gorgonifer]|uniref:Protein FAF1 n=1 Tax=Cephalotrichum gorgonifer TaxID=2041049 RepID=A0AAE8MTY7_9PEZI|nr:uncharacterized protein DNG_03251 [Cephalotrichum gorgonifer]